MESVPRLRNARTLAVDASLGRPEEVGTVAVGVGSLRPGAGVQKTLPEVGQYYVTGTVNIGGFMDYYVLQNTRLALVMRMAQTVAESIKLSLGF
jgi:putative sporulation protein YyaC